MGFYASHWKQYLPDVVVLTAYGHALLPTEKTNSYDATQLLHGLADGLAFP
jgi:hypothetical protein